MKGMSDVRGLMFEVADWGFETPSLPALSRSYPRRFTFFVANPISSIRRAERARRIADWGERKVANLADLV